MMMCARICARAKSANLREKVNHSVVTPKFSEEDNHDDLTHGRNGGPTALHAHRGAATPGLSRGVASGATSRRLRGAKDSLLQECDLAEDRFRVPHHCSLDHVLYVVPHEAARATAQPPVTRTIGRVRAAN